jgi:hypothetical protein
METGDWITLAAVIVALLIGVASIVVTLIIRAKDINKNRRVEAKKRDFEIKLKALDDLKTWACEIFEFIVFFKTADGSEAREAGFRSMHLLDEYSALSILINMFDNKNLKDQFKDLRKGLSELNRIMTSEPPQSGKKLTKGKESEVKKVADNIFDQGNAILFELTKEKVKLYKG